MGVSGDFTAFHPTGSGSLDYALAEALNEIGRIAD